MLAAFTGDLRRLVGVNLFCLSLANTIAQAVLEKLDGICIWDLAPYHLGT